LGNKMTGLNLTYMSGGNKAWVLTLITTMIIVLGAVVFVVGPTDTQTDTAIVTDDMFIQFGEGITLPDMPQPGPASPIPITRPPSQPLAQTLPPNIFVQSGSPRPVTLPIPVPTPTGLVPQQATLQPTTPIRTPSPVRLPTSSTGPPITGTPVLGTGAVRQYPFAVVFECDWQGGRLSLTTKTMSSSVVRLCIEAPPLPATEAPVEISFLSFFVFTRQPYEGSTAPLAPMTQHAVLAGKPDPFGLTVLRCPEGVRICRLATDLRNEFFTQDAYLVGQGELALQYVDEPQAIAGVSPISIYFLLSSIDIPEPLLLGRLSRTSQSTASSYSRPIGRGRRKQKAFLSNEKNSNENNTKATTSPPT
jgi:hypothetical protein